MPTIRLIKRRALGIWLMLLVAGLVTLNGVGWFFVGPSLATFEQDTGVELVEFVGSYPEAAGLLALQARNTAILLIGIGLLGAVATLPLRRGGPAVFGADGWIFGLVLVAVGLSGAFSGAVFGIAYIGLGLLALLGKVLSSSS